MDSKMHYSTLIIVLILMSGKFVSCRDGIEFDDDVFDDFGDTYGQIVSVFISLTAGLIFICICVACCGCCRRRDNGAVYSSECL